jgi:NAD(P)-dependent dehydrogenase (short-subunit alcohol dehydrogenase family)
VNNGRRLPLEGRVAVITGAGSGLGQAAALRFAEDGAVVVVADISGERAEETAAAVEATGGIALAATADVADPASVDRLTQEAVDLHGAIDCLYNNAGGPPARDGDLTELTLDEWHAAMRVDLFGTILCSRAVAAHMITRGSGSIINTASCTALRGIAGRDAYVAAKGAVVALTRSMAADLAPHGIRVNAVAPGVTTSARVLDLLQHDARTRALVDRHVLGLVEPEHVAATAAFLASDGAARTTGQILSVDSGATDILSVER